MNKSTKKNPKQERLKRLSTGDTKVNKVIRAFLKVDPKKVDERLIREGIKKRKSNEKENQFG